MKTASLMIISDARVALAKAAYGEAAENALAAAFLGWLLRSDDLLPFAQVAAKRAAAAKGAERSSRNVAILGFACGIEQLKPAFATEFSAQLDWLIGRPNFAAGGEPCGVVADPMNLAGVVVGAESVLGAVARPKFDMWVAGVRKDADALAQDGNWQRSLLETMGRRASSGQARVSLGSFAWFEAALQRRGWSAPAEESVGEVLKSALVGADKVTDGFEAGLRLSAIDWAVQRAMDFDIAAPTLCDVAAILHRVSTVFQRWTWEEKPRTTRAGAEPRRWHIENEYHFQSLLFAVLKPLVPALEEEKYLPPTGTYQPRADLCIASLETVIEVKFWYQSKSIKELTEEIAADLTLYLRPDSPYKKVIAAIWDDGTRTESQAELKRGLTGLSGLADVVIVNRPAFMGERAKPTAKKKKR